MTEAYETPTEERGCYRISVKVRTRRHEFGTQYYCTIIQSHSDKVKIYIVPLRHLLIIKLIRDSD